MPYRAKAHIIGHLGRDIETKFSTGGKPYGKFSVAVGRTKGTEKETDWYDVTIFDPPKWKVDLLVKGAVVSVEGRLQIRKYEGRNGAGTSVEIVATDCDVFPKGERAEQKQADPPHAFAQPITDLDVPF